MIVLLDMDGVIADFVGGANKAHGYREDLDWTKWSAGLSSEEFWEPINACSPEFWRNLEPYPWTNLLTKSLMHHFNDVYICTSPAHEPCSSAKVEWVREHLPEYYHRRFVITNHKHLLAGPDTILIDDSDHNILKFTRAGGHGVLFPQPWNKWRDSIAYSPAARVSQVLAEVLQIADL